MELAWQVFLIVVWFGLVLWGGKELHLCHILLFFILQVILWEIKLTHLGAKFLGMIQSLNSALWSCWECASYFNLNGRRWNRILSCCSLKPGVVCVQGHASRALPGIDEHRGCQDRRNHKDTCLLWRLTLVQWVFDNLTQCFLQWHCNLRYAHPNFLLLLPPSLRVKLTSQHDSSLSRSLLPPSSLTGICPMHLLHS